MHFSKNDYLLWYLLPLRIVTILSKDSDYNKSNTESSGEHLINSKFFVLFDLDLLYVIEMLHVLEKNKNIRTL